MGEEGLPDDLGLITPPGGVINDDAAVEAVVAARAGMATFQEPMADADAEEAADARVAARCRPHARAAAALVAISLELGELCPTYAFSLQVRESP